MGPLQVVAAACLSSTGTGAGLGAPLDSELFMGANEGASLSPAVAAAGDWRGSGREASSHVSGLEAAGQMDMAAAVLVA